MEEDKKPEETRIPENMDKPVEEERVPEGNQDEVPSEEITKEEPQNKNTFSGIARAVIWFFVFVFIALFLVYALRYTTPAESDTYYKYNNFDFVYSDGMWHTQIQRGIQPFNIPVRYSPREVEDLLITGTRDPKEFLDLKANYVTFDPDEENLNYTALAMAELSLNMAQALDITPLGACTKNLTRGCVNRTIISCETDTEHAIIYLKPANETKVQLIDNCLTVQGEGLELVRAVDRLLLYWYGIVP